MDGFRMQTQYLGIKHRAGMRKTTMEEVKKVATVPTDDEDIEEEKVDTEVDGIKKVSKLTRGKGKKSSSKVSKEK